MVASPKRECCGKKLDPDANFCGLCGSAVRPGNSHGNDGMYQFSQHDFILT